MLPLLHLAQDQDGWVTPEAMEEIAELLDLTPALVLGTCSFYTMFKREPVGQAARVGVHERELPRERRPRPARPPASAATPTTPTCTVEEVECIAACDLAPVLQVNYEFHGPLTGDAADDAHRRVQAAATRVARTISGTPSAERERLMAATETRIVTKFLRERPDDSWTIDAALAQRRVRRL